MSQGFADLRHSCRSPSIPHGFLLLHHGRGHLRREVATKTRKSPSRNLPRLGYCRRLQRPGSGVSSSHAMVPARWWSVCRRCQLLVRYFRGYRSCAVSTPPPRTVFWFPGGMSADETLSTTGLWPVSSTTLSGSPYCPDSAGTGYGRRFWRWITVRKATRSSRFRSTSLLIGMPPMISLVAQSPNKEVIRRRSLATKRVMMSGLSRSERCDRMNSLSLRGLWLADVGSTLSINFSRREKVLLHVHLGIIYDGN